MCSEYVRRTLGIRDKQILYIRANKKCENCGNDIDFDEMQVGHKIPFSKGGSTTLRNSVCLCYRCNKLQGTDSWATFQKKQGKEDSKLKIKKSLQTLNVKQLKMLSDNYSIKIKGQIVEDRWTSYRKAPTKSQCIRKLAGLVTEEEIHSVPKIPSKAATKRRTSSS